MQLKPEILAVLNNLGATDIEIAKLTDYYAAQLADADALVGQIKTNIDSLQTQLGEAQAHADALRVAIGKFVSA